MLVVADDNSHKMIGIVTRSDLLNPRARVDALWSGGEKTYPSEERITIGSQLSASTRYSSGDQSQSCDGEVFTEPQTSVSGRLLRTPTLTIL